MPKGEIIVLTHRSGNEKCRKSNPNCTAVYGPGVLASLFEWENFDAVTFLVAANNGYPMSILDMANVVKSEPSKRAIATVKCNPPHYSANYWNVGANEPDDKKCYSPSFSLKRDAITLPHINQTASQVYERMVGKPNGDCDLVR